MSLQTSPPKIPQRSPPKVPPKSPPTGLENSITYRASDILPQIVKSTTRQDKTKTPSLEATSRALARSWPKNTIYIPRYICEKFIKNIRCWHKNVHTLHMSYKKLCKMVTCQSRARVSSENFTYITK